MTPFTFDFTQSKLAQCLTTNKNVLALHTSLTKVLPQYDISSTVRVAAFLAQCGHESVDFTILQENLRYGPAGLQKIFKKYFPSAALVQQYAGQPEPIANRVYADRMGNGPETSGDGYRFRGRGAIQLTGRNNYQAFATSIHKTLDDTVTYCGTLDGAIESACWFWNTKNLNALADRSDLIAMTKVINGGLHGLEDRQARFNKCRVVLV